MQRKRRICRLIILSLLAQLVFCGCTAPAGGTRSAPVQTQASAASSDPSSPGQPSGSQSGADSGPAEAGDGAPDPQGQQSVGEQPGLPAAGEPPQTAPETGGSLDDEAGSPAGPGQPLPGDPYAGSRQPPSDDASGAAPEAQGDPPDRPVASSQRADPTAQPGAIPLSNQYIQQVADGLLDQLIRPGMSDIEKVTTVYRYLVLNTRFDDPVGLDIWRYRGDPMQLPTYCENRALSPMLFGIGSCEDFAGAMVVLLRRMGFEAEYVAGLTISVRGDFVDHAWAVVELEGQWYHLDPQLENNVIRNNRLRYRYFLCSDRVMEQDHRWGENLIQYLGDQLDEAERADIRERFTPPPCPASIEPPEAEMVSRLPNPDRNSILRELEREREAYEQRYGPLEPLELQTVPPDLTAPLDWPFEL